MPIALSSRDVVRTQSVTETLLSPLRHESLDAWRRNVCRDTKELLGADMATFRLPSTEGALYVADGLDPAVLDDYSDRVAELAQEVDADHGFSYWERMVKLGVWDRKRLQAPYLAEYFRSTYYNEFIVPIRAHDALGLTIALEDPPSAMRTAELTLHHGREDGPRFGKRGIALLRILQPAFRAGIQAFRALGRRRRELTRLLDSLADGVRIHDADGAILHESMGLRRILEAEPPPGRRALRAGMDAVAGRLLSSLSGVPGRPTAPDGVMRRVRTPLCTYRVGASYADGSLAGRSSRSVVVVVHPVTPEPPDEAWLRERFGLTPRQAQVAVLLAAHMSNAEIAGALVISPHTARHHTESVLRKLDIHSRRDVETAIRAATSENGDGRAS